MVTITGNGSTDGLTIRGLTLNDANFTFSYNARQRVIEAAEDPVERTENEIVWVDTVTSIVDNEADLVIEETIQNSIVNGSFINLTPEVASLSSSAQLTRITDGTASIIYKSQRLGRRVDIPISRTGGETVTEFDRFQDDSLAEHMRDAIDSRIAGKTPLTAMPIWSTRNNSNAIYTWNTDGWLSDIKMTCLSPWNSYEENKMAGTLISPRHVLFAQHYTPFVNPSSPPTIRFIRPNGTVVTKTIVNGVACGPWDYSDGGRSDMFVGLLNEDVPADILFAKFLPTDFTQRITCFNKTPSVRIPIIRLNQFKLATVGDWTTYNKNTLFSAYIPSDSTRLSFYSDAIPFDSGCPAFTIINGQYVILSIWRLGGYGAGPALMTSYTQTKINEAMLTLGGDYSITNVDISEFPEYL